jgi:hypothetical protein
MKFTDFRAFAALLAAASSYMISGTPARADGWGCEVILCLSNPGGPTQFAACRPPVEKLWSHLAKGRSFPTCSGVGFSASRPGYEPYYCNAGFRLTSRYGGRGNEAACVSIGPREVSSSRCTFGDQNQDSSQSPARWVREHGRSVCKGTVAVAPNQREKPHFVDVTIDGQGRQRVWF